ncbi:MAG: hypothetical protein LBC99_09100 [Spirochaetota bacterium]|nr:hypothetical protein [Spirochaetota bacterium]
MLTQAKRNLLDVYAQGLERYKRQDFQDALRFFREARNIDPEDGPACLYIERCTAYLNTPPPQDWDGVFTMTTK